jgi:hypothetical protein
MSTSNENSTGLTLAWVGGGALLLWFLWPGRDKGTSDNGDNDGIRDIRERKPVHVRIRSGDQLDLDEVSSDLATTVGRARAAGVAYVLAVGDARTGWVNTVIDALKAAGVDVYRVQASGVDAYHPPGALAPRNARASRLPGRRVPVEAHSRSWPRHGA